MKVNKKQIIIIQSIKVPIVYVNVSMNQYNMQK
jgi:hypothetical protein